MLGAAFSGHPLPLPSQIYTGPTQMGRILGPIPAINAWSMRHLGKGRAVCDMWERIKLVYLHICHILPYQQRKYEIYESTTRVVPYGARTVTTMH